MSLEKLRRVQAFSARDVLQSAGMKNLQVETVLKAYLPAPAPAPAQQHCIVNSAIGAFGYCRKRYCGQGCDACGAG
jgi:hypothetical protein